MRLRSMLSVTGDSHQKFANAAAARADAPILHSYTPPHPRPTQRIVDAVAAQTDAETLGGGGGMYPIAHLKAA